MYFSLIKYITLILCINFYINSQSPGWFPLNTNTNGNLSFMDLPNDQTVYISTDILMFVLKTTNAGLNFSVLHPPVNFPIKMFNNGWGYVGNLPTIFRTTNGGSLWNFDFPTWWMGQLSVFVTPLRGYVVGAITNDIRFWETYDGGTTFTRISTINDSDFRLLAFYFLNEYTGFILGKNISSPHGGKIYRTNDAGRTWDLPYTDQIDADDTASITHTSGNILYAAGYRSGILKSIDGGSSWILLPVSGFTPPFTVLTFVSGLNGFIKEGTGKIIRTRDGGNTWAVEFYESEQINNIKFINELTGYAAGNNGKLLKTTDGGNMVGINLISNQLPIKYDLGQNYPNPFNPVTIIRFDILNAENVNLSVYNAEGRFVKQLVNQRLSPGSYRTEFDASANPSGVYYYILKSNSFSKSLKMILVK